ncbi:kinase-like domain-containing protein, partial [Zychaea mexicana]|uniref:kinase-like domain-containing protein n=1 Tax=Zychaea mexicana TaxID=64656 RepID=UPI0022FE6C79
KLGNTIGKGQFGTVHRALNLNTGQMVAIKRIKLDPSKIDDMDEVMQEAQILRTLSHANIVKYEGFIQTSECMNIVLEFVENGSLASTLKAFGSFPENLVASYCLRILKGLAYLHQERVVHCDLKAANILTTKNGDVKLSDFGVSVNLKLKESLTGSVAGTPNWMAPEVIELQGASTKSDIWSLGCTVIELYTGKPPYADLIPMTTLFRIVEDDCPPLPENGPDDLKDFLRLCFRKVPKERPTAVELLDHPWILRHNHDHQPSNNEESNCNNLTVTEGPGPHRRQAEQQEAVESRPLSSLYPRDFQYSAENVEHRRTASGHQLSQHPPSILVNKLQERQEKGRKSPPIVREHCFIKGSFPKGI